ncbi:MAG: amidohydrolase [Chrysiogenetes bacterium]|nr:amidohydrolase [Chrysiogenetes bacterium]
MLFRCARHAPEQGHGHGRASAKGARNRRIDIHCHVYVAEVEALLPDDDDGAQDAIGSLTDRINAEQHRLTLPALTDPEVRLADMERQGIDIQVLSPAPFQYGYHLPPETGREVARTINERIATLAEGHPSRFTALGTVPLQEPGMAVAELERCVTELGMKGIEIDTRVNGRDLTRVGLERLFARAEELGAVLFMHPIGTSIAQRMDDHYFPNLLGHPMESALALGHLVFDGWLARHPDLKLVVAHGGGFLPAYWGRLDHAWRTRADCRQNIDREPSHYLRRVHVDTVVFDALELRHLIEAWGPERVLLGTDYPFDMGEPDPVGLLGRVDGLTASARALIECGNAARLLGMPQAVT